MNHPNVDFFVQLESEVWAALASGDALADERLLDKDFMGVYSSGFAGKSEHMAQLASAPTVQSYALSRARITLLCESVVMLSYLAKWTRQRADSRAEEEMMFISSIWKQSEGVWRNVFSQDTKADV